MRWGPHLLQEEDLNHTGSHKINNVLGQALLASRMGKTRIIAETGAGQHGVASATAAALMGLECVVYMGKEDTQRQALNVARMQLLGATVVPVETGSQTLKDAINEAMRDWVTNVATTHYLLGTVTGPSPFPRIVRHFHSVIGRETREQILEIEGRLPDAAVACVGGGSNAMGLFSAFLDDPEVRLVGYEAGGEGVESGRHAARFAMGAPGVLHGARTYVMQDEWGQTIASHSISAGLDYPGPEQVATSGRATYEPVTDADGSVLDRESQDTAGDRNGACSRGGYATGSRARSGCGDRDQSVRAGGQGRGNCCSLVWNRHDVNPRTAAVFDAARTQQRSALIGYLPAGFPNVDDSVEIFQTMLDTGVDLLEVGLPYSDPLMDGPAIQKSVEIALECGVTTADVLNVVDRLTPAEGQAVYVMSYWNPIERFGMQKFADELAAGGGSGVITPDLTPEEADAWIEVTKAAGIDRTFLVAPSSTDARIDIVSGATTGFVYAASTMGVTGTRDTVSDAAPQLVGRVRERTSQPIGVGLGVSSAEQAASIAGYADGVIVGSAFIRRVLDAESSAEATAEVGRFAAELREGVGRSTHLSEPDA